MKKELVIIGYVWPEPQSSAAGYRMLQLIELLQHLNYKTTFACPSIKEDYAFNLNSINVNAKTIEVNNSDFDVWIKQMNPELVIFDRFLMEEQFGWRVAHNCPNALRILDTEDLHCLRKVRQDCLKKNIKFSVELLKEYDITKREIASVLRSDYSLIISEYEMNLLIKEFQIPFEQLVYLPFIDQEKTRLNLSFKERSHFMTIGSFRHQPNVDSVLFLKEKIWPLIRERLPFAELHVYGSYPKQQITQLHNPKLGFLIKGWAKDASEVIGKSRVMLSPLRFGAGIKGKFFDAVLNGTPSVTTSIGAEGMILHEDWMGFVEDDIEKIIDRAIELYTNELLWDQENNKKREILDKYFNKNKYATVLKNRIINRTSYPKSFVQEMINFHSFRHAKFMSKWIEEKNQ